MASIKADDGDNRGIQRQVGKPNAPDNGWSLVGYLRLDIRPNKKSYSKGDLGVEKESERINMLRCQNTDPLLGGDGQPLKMNQSSSSGSSGRIDC
jgi:hypothetical protein